jgi:hypothetical protein
MPIEKRKLDEKTYELYNTDRDKPSIGPTPITQAAQGMLEGIRSGDVARQMFEEAQVKEKHRVVPSEPGGWAKATSVDDFLQAAREAPREQKSAWRKQFSQFDKTLRGKQVDPNVPIEGIQEMLDTGAIYMDDDGNVYSAVPGRGGPKRNERLLSAAREWGDWYRDRTQDTEENRLANIEMNSVVNQGEWKYDTASGGYTR